jgi:hypothetical protein
MTSRDYRMLLSQVEEIADKNNLKDYHAFVYWFAETVFGYDHERILNSICDGTHDIMSLCIRLVTALSESLLNRNLHLQDQNDRDYLVSRLQRPSEFEPN